MLRMGHYNIRRMQLSSFFLRATHWEKAPLLPERDFYILSLEKGAANWIWSWIPGRVRNKSECALVMNRKWRLNVNGGTGEGLPRVSFGSFIYSQVLHWASSSNTKKFHWNKFKRHALQNLMGFLYFAIWLIIMLYLFTPSFLCYWGLRNLSWTYLIKNLSQGKGNIWDQSLQQIFIEKIVRV